MIVRNHSHGAVNLKHIPWTWWHNHLILTEEAEVGGSSTRPTWATSEC